MSTRESAVKPLYRPIKNSELKPVAEIYKGLITKPGVLVLFTAEDGSVDATWVTDFGTAITAVGNVVSSKTIISLNKDITKGIKDNSKKSVKYGKRLTRFLKKAFPDQPGLQESFMVIAVNDKMRLGETEGMLYDLNTLIQQINVPANNTALVAAGWPTSNLTDYEALRTTVNALNIQQELAKKLVPENTDAATVVRNTCYGFIQTLVQLKDIVYDDNALQKSSWTIAANLKQIRVETGGATIVLEADINMGQVLSLDLAGLVGKTFATAKFEAVDADMKYYASETNIGVPGAVFLAVTNGTSVTKTYTEAGIALGGADSKPFVNVQNVGAGAGHYRVTFKGVK